MPIARKIKDTTDLTLIGKGVKFTWGEIIQIHSVGSYDVIESQNEEKEISFHPYVDGKDWSHSYDSLDEALCACIAVSHGDVWGDAAKYMMRVAGAEN